MAAATVPFPILTEKNFSSWKFRVRTMLEKEGVADVLDIKLEDVREENKVSFTTKDAKARYTIVQSISDKYCK